MQDEIKVKKETVLWSNKLKALSEMMDTMRGNILLITSTLHKHGMVVASWAGKVITSGVIMTPLFFK